MAFWKYDLFKRHVSIIKLDSGNNEMVNAKVINLRS